MSKNGHTGVQVETVGQEIHHVLRSDGVEVAVDGTLADDNNGLALAQVTVSLDFGTHVIAPVLARWGTLGDEDKVGSSGDTGHQGEPTAVASHDLDNKRARVTGGSAGDRVDAFADTVETSDGADGDVG